MWCPNRLVDMASIDYTRQHGFQPTRWSQDTSRPQGSLCLGRDFERPLVPFSRGSRGWTPLHLAARSGHDFVVWRLLEAKAPVDAENEYGRGLRQRLGGENPLEAMGSSWERWSHLHGWISFGLFSVTNMKCQELRSKTGVSCFFQILGCPNSRLIFFFGVCSVCLSLLIQVMLAANMLLTGLFQPTRWPQDISKRHWVC